MRASLAGIAYFFSAHINIILAASSNLDSLLTCEHRTTATAGTAHTNHPGLLTQADYQPLTFPLSMTTVASPLMTTFGHGSFNVLSGQRSDLRGIWTLTATYLAAIDVCW